MFIFCFRLLPSSSHRFQRWWTSQLMQFPLRTHTNLYEVWSNKLPLTLWLVFLDEVWQNLPSAGRASITTSRNRWRGTAIRQTPLNRWSVRTQVYTVWGYNTVTCLELRGTATVLRCCATSRKVAGSIPGRVSGFFIDTKSFRSHYGSGVNSPSNKNEYQEYFLGVKAAGA